MTHRSADIHWPDGLTPTDADLFARNEIVIQAPPHQVLQHLIGDRVATVVLKRSQRRSRQTSELLSEGATFQWTTFGLGISSSVAEIGLGHGAKRLAQTNPGHMHRGHGLWNISLKFLSET